MGSSSSSPISAQTHDQAFNKTADTRMIMDELLNYMIKQLSVRDLLHMSKESECKKYVLFKANAIYQHFYELRIFPTTDAKGLLTFRRVEDLVNPKGEQEKERQSLCLIVAYFYTRIFQIYGALALTLIDDVNAMTSSGIMTTFKRGNNMRGQTPGYYAQAPYYGRGGEITLLASKPPSSTVSLKNFEWIRSFLIGDTPLTKGYNTRYAGTGNENGTVLINIENVLRDNTKSAGGKPIFGTPPPTSYQYATCEITIPSMNQWNTLELFTRIAPGEIKVKLGKLTFKNTEKEDIIVSKFEREFNIDTQTNLVKDQSITDVSEFMANLLSEIIIYLKSAVKKTKDTIYHDGNIRDSNYRGTRSARNTNSVRGSYNYGNRGNRGTISRKSEEGITSHLKVEKMIDNLATRRPLGHCIARALQLLKTEPLPNQPGISQICSVAFDGKGTKTNRIGLPKSDEALSEHPGLFALANLFYDTIMIGSPHLIIGKNIVKGQSTSTFQDYVTFMTTLSKQYAMGATLTPQEMEEKGLSGIINKRDGKICTSADDIPLSLETTSEVHKIVKSMFDMQVKHASECEKIISMLFTITRNPTTKKPVMFKLNDNVISKGFPELERINREARKILVDYYTNCEKKYVNGMKLIWMEKDEKIKEGVARANAELKREQEIKAKIQAELEKEEAAKVTPRILTPLERQIQAAKLAAAKKEEENTKQKKDIQARSALSQAELEREQKDKALLKKQKEEAILKREKELRAQFVKDEEMKVQARGKPPVGK